MNPLPISLDPLGKTNWWLDLLLAVSHRLLSIAMFAAVAVPFTFLFAADQRLAVSAAYVCALLPGIVSLVICTTPAFPLPRRREARGLAIVSLIVLLLVFPLMKSSALRQKLQRIGSSMTATG